MEEELKELIKVCTLTEKSYLCNANLLSEFLKKFTPDFFEKKLYKNSQGIIYTYKVMIKGAKYNFITNERIDIS